MWNKDKRDEAVAVPQAAPTPTPAPAPMPQPAAEIRAAAPAERPPAPKSSGGFALIGRSISIHGEVTGDEDLLIQGRVQGSVDLKQHSVTVGTEGEVKADIFARIVTVEGRVVGNVTGQEQVVLRASARVEGDIAAPRVVLEDGTVFRGSVEMGEVKTKPQPSSGPAARVAASEAPAPESVKQKNAGRVVQEVRA
jgi:cytoskeletal protein CcmA (bactofilin family)